MFEYLMPLLILRSHPDTLLENACRAAVRAQILLPGSATGVPWGISESAYNVVDPHGSYQYKAFGVPGLGLKRGLAEDLVIAPYATALATLVDPTAAAANLRRLAREGLQDGSDSRRRWTTPRASPRRPKVRRCPNRVGFTRSVRSSPITRA